MPPNRTETFCMVSIGSHFVDTAIRRHLGMPPYGEKQQDSPAAFHIALLLMLYLIMTRHFSGKISDIFKFYFHFYAIKEGFPCFEPCGGSVSS